MACHDHDAGMLSLNWSCNLMPRHWIAKTVLLNGKHDLGDALCQPRMRDAVIADYKTENINATFSDLAGPVYIEDLACLP